MRTLRATQKIAIGLTLIFVALFIFTNNTGTVFADSCQSSTTHYCLLAPLGATTSVDMTTLDVGAYFNNIIKIFIGLLSVLAVVMVVIGGIQYMTSTSSGEKGGGKNRILNAIYGLVLVLASYMILRTINPKLVNLQIGVPTGSTTLLTDGK